MKLKSTEFKVIEWMEDEDYGMVIGNINIDSEGINYVEIIDTTMMCMEDVDRMRLFLDEVEKEFKKWPST